MNICFQQLRFPIKNLARLDRISSVYRAGTVRACRSQQPKTRSYSQYRYSEHHFQQQNSEPGYSPNGPEGKRVLLGRPIIWALAFTTGTFYVCSNHYVSHKEKLLQSTSSIWDLLGLRSQLDGRDDQIWIDDSNVQRLVGHTYRAYSESHARMVRRIARLPDWVPYELKRTAVAFSGTWYQLSRGERCVYTIAAVNAVVFGMWQIPRLLPFMTRSFLHNPSSGLSYTMLTSSFSHSELWHFAFNSIALVSFGIPVANAMGAEQFTAFYLSAGVLSSLASHLLAPLRPALILPSLGASGAVYGVLGATMMMFPNSHVALIFLPFIPISISHAFTALLAYDFAGAVLGWKTFGHIAHLSGGLYGVGYLKYGTDYWKSLVNKVISYRQSTK